LDRAVLEQKNGAELVKKLDSRLADHCLLDSRLPLVRCPFCDYAEVDEVYHPDGPPRVRITPAGMLKLVLLSGILGAMSVAMQIVLFLLVALVCLLVLCSRRTTVSDRLATEWQAAVSRHHRRAVGSKFTCRAPACGQVSCLSCGKGWADVHVCNESSLMALRTQVEQAMSMAVKRVCPRCSTSFVKTAGCNKLTCPCGYKMCYVCRADLTEEGYRHFCEHFRPEGSGQPCTQCERCNLWETEDTERVLREAKEEAERKWREAERRDLTGAERAFLNTGIKSAEREGGALMKLLMLPRRGRWLTLAEAMDVLVGSLLV
jgi:hypothetical protein